MTRWTWLWAVAIVVACNGSDGDGDTPAACEACDDVATCAWMNGEHRCVCPDEYSDVNGDGSLCELGAVCDPQTNPCQAPAQCVLTDEGNRCQCPPGYAISGNGCQDVNECTNGAATCHPDATCNNTIGSYQCQCRAGFSGDGHSCYDIDECSSAQHDCYGGYTWCINVPGSFVCECSAVSLVGDGRLSGTVCVSGVSSCSHWTQDCESGLPYIQQCSQASVCASGSSCQNGAGGGACVCNPGVSSDDQDPPCGHSVMPGQHQSTWNAGGQRGYWFTAPKNMLIMALRVPHLPDAVDPVDGSQYIQVLKFNLSNSEVNQALHDVSATTFTNNVTRVWRINHVGTDDFVRVNIPILKGETIGILGGRYRFNSGDSYGRFSRAEIDETTGTLAMAIADTTVTTHALQATSEIQSGDALNFSGGKNMGRTELIVAW